jgi:putative ABC transport system permease protein
MLTTLVHTLRQLTKSPGFTAACVLVIALGIGANTAIFSVVNATLLRPLPFPDPDRLVRVYEAFDEPDARANTLSLSEITVQQWREHGSEVFSDFAAATGASVTLGALGDQPARSFAAARITANFLSTLGLPPALGRNFTAEEDRPGGPRVAIVSHEFWQRELGGRTDVLEQPVTLDHAPYAIVGVMPKNFRHPYRAAVWLPLAAAFEPAAGRGHFLYGAARLRPGVTLAQADAALRRICAAVNTAQPDPLNPRRAYLRPLREGFVIDLQPKLLVIAAAALCTLLVAAANFAGLLLARSVAREGETAVRAALGASRGRLVRETLATALVLAALGTAAGLLLATWLTPALVALSPEGADATGSAMREFDHTVRLDWPVFGFAAGALLLAGAGFGLLPAWRAARTDLRTVLGAGSRSVTLDRGTRRLLGALVVGEIAAAAVLLVMSGLLTQYFKKLLDEPWGVRTEQRLTFNAMLSDRLVADGPARTRTIDRTLAELAVLPGVQAVTATLPHPLNGARQLMSLNVEGHTAPEPRGSYLGYLRAATPGYFATLGQSLVRGRDFTADDRANTPPVIVVNESFAKRFWPGQDPIGKRVKWGRLTGPRPWFTVVGVAADTKIIADPNDGEIVGTLVLPMAQVLGVANAFDEFTFVLHTAARPELAERDEPRALESAARGALARADSRLAAYDIASLNERAAETRVTERFALVLVSLFGALGLVLAAIGLYGLLALQVTRRTKEFGVRSALGATSASLARLVLGYGARLLALGLLLGSASAWAVFRVAHSRWPELPELKVFPFAAAAALLAVAVALACWLPARKAARVDPINALRAE